MEYKCFAMVAPEAVGYLQFFGGGGLKKLWIAGNLML